MAERVFPMPDLGEGLEEGEIVVWLVAEGEQVELNQPLVEVETAKATVEIPSPYAGRVIALGGPVGAAVAVGAPLVTFQVEDGGGGGRAAATPAVRAEARALGVGIDGIAGTGPQGRVTSEDVRAAAAATRTTPTAAEPRDVFAPYDTVEVGGIRKVSADRLTKVVRETPLVTTFRTVDCSALEQVRAEGHASPLPVVLKALADVCTRHPLLNASWVAEPPQIRRYRRVDAGIGIDAEHGLTVGVVRDVGGRSVGEIREEIVRLAEAARGGTLSIADTAGSTVTVSNTGSYGSEAGTPIPEPGVAAVLAIGVIQPRALVVDGEVVARSACTLSLTFDHRVLDGAAAGRALTDLVGLLQDATRLRDLVR